MSDTPIDMAKVTQMLDAGWQVHLFRGGMGGYVAKAVHDNIMIWERARDAMTDQVRRANPGMDTVALLDLMAVEFSDEGVIDTEDFTPEQALTRLAYKVHGEII